MGNSERELLSGYGSGGIRIECGGGDREKLCGGHPPVRPDSAHGGNDRLFLDKDCQLDVIPLGQACREAQAEVIGRRNDTGGCLNDPGRRDFD